MKAGLTSADLDDVRQSALGAADPLGVAADLADAATDGRLADKNDAGHALTIAAEIAESRAKLDAAQRYADQAVDAYGDLADDRAAAAHALRARILFRNGRADEAMAELEPLRPRLAHDPDAAAYLSAALAVGGRLRDAEQWLTEAVQTAVDQRTGDPSTAADAGQLFFLLQQRHRVRHQLGRSHDQHDNLAERLETRLANATPKTGDDLLFWPRAEFDRLLERWPALAESYGTDWDEHRAHLERSLVQSPGRGPLPGTVAGLVSYAGKDDPSTATARTGYARRLAEIPAQLPWPPERNGACWCGSGDKYKKCCLPRSR